jgi:hypothetical protein
VRADFQEKNEKVTCYTKFNKKGQLKNWPFLLYGVLVRYGLTVIIFLAIAGYFAIKISSSSVKGFCVWTLAKRTRSSISRASVSSLNSISNLPKTC